MLRGNSEQRLIPAGLFVDILPCHTGFGIQFVMRKKPPLLLLPRPRHSFWPAPFSGPPSRKLSLRPTLFLRGRGRRTLFLGQWGHRKEVLILILFYILLLLYPAPILWIPEAFVILTLVWYLTTSSTPKLPIFLRGPLLREPLALWAILFSQPSIQKLVPLPCFIFFQELVTTEILTYLFTCLISAFEM